MEGKDGGCGKDAGNGAKIVCCEQTLTQALIQENSYEQN